LWKQLRHDADHSGWTRQRAKSQSRSPARKAAS
jgi:hypothetical protein